MRVYVTGAQGFIGKAVLPLVETVQMDESPEAIIHCAWKWGDDGANLLSTAQAALVAADNDVPFVYCSSTSAGNQTPYGDSKAAGEDVTEIVGGCSVRLSYPVGYGQIYGVIPTITKKILRGEPVLVGQRLSFTHIDDCAEALVSAIGERGVKVCAGRAYNVMQVAYTIGAILAIDPIFEHHDAPDEVVEATAERDPLLAIEDYARGIRDALGLTTLHDQPHSLKRTRSNWRQDHG